MAALYNSLQAWGEKEKLATPFSTVEILHHSRKLKFTRVGGSPL